MATYYTIKLRRDTASNWASVNPVLELAEVGIVTGTNPQQLKFGDGSTRWNSLPTQYFLTANIADVLSAYVSKAQVQQSVGERTDLPMSQKAVTDLFNLSSTQPLSPLPNTGDPSTIQYPRDYVWPSYDSGRATDSYYVTSALGWNLDYRLSAIEQGLSLDTATNGQCPVFDSTVNKFIPRLFSITELIDVQLNGPLQEGQVLSYHIPLEGQPYWWNTVGGGGGNGALGNVILNNPINGQVLTYVVPEDQPNENGYWTNGTGGGSDGFGTVVIDNLNLDSGQVLTFVIPEGGSVSDGYWTNRDISSSFGTVIIDDTSLQPGQTLVYTVPIDGEPYWTNGASAGSLSVANTGDSPTQFDNVTKIIFAGSTISSSEAGVVQVSGGSASAADLNSLSDVDTPTYNVNQALVVKQQTIDGVTGNYWTPVDYKLSALSDVDQLSVNAPAANDVLTFNGTKWEARAGGGGATYTSGDGISVNNSTHVISAAISGSGGLTASGGTLAIKLKSNSGLVTNSYGLGLATGLANSGLVPNSTNVSNRWYSVLIDPDDGHLIVNVPWIEGSGGTSDTYAAGTGLSKTGSGGSYTFSLNTAGSGTLGGIAIGFNTSASSQNYAVELSSNRAYVHVPWTDTKYTASSSGGLSLSGTEFSIANNGVTTARILNGAVTADKLAADSVITVKIKNGAVTPDKLSVAYLPLTAGSGKALTGDLYVGSSSSAKQILCYGKLTVYSGGVSIAGASTFSTTVTTDGKLTVRSGGADITGNSIITGTLLLSDTLNARGNVVIGTSSASRTLTVYGSTTSGIILKGGTYTTNIYRTSAYLYIDSKAYFGGQITVSGGAEITGATNVYGAFTVTGNINATGNIVAGTSSDRRLKDNVETISFDNAISVLNKLNPVSFTWNSLALSLGGHRGDSYGFIAQEFIKIFKDNYRMMWDNYYGIDYNVVIPYLTAGWQSHESRIESLESRVTVLENIVES